MVQNYPHFSNILNITLYIDRETEIETDIHIKILMILQRGF